jgi:hypothetical protein
MEIDLKSPTVTISAELFQKLASFLDDRSDCSEVDGPNKALRLWGELSDAADVANVPYIARELAMTIAPTPIEFERRAWGY